jgi:hypothetical protein
MQEVLAAIYSTLTAGTALMARVSGGVWLGVAPGTALYPFVTVDFYSGSDNVLFEGGWADQTFTVKCVDQSTSAVAALAVQALIDATLKRAALSISGRTTLMCRRVTPVFYQEVSGDEVYWHAGGNYRVTSI